MTDQTIPAEKVRELIEYFEGTDMSTASYEMLGRFRALLPAPPQPTSGLFLRTATHPKHGEVTVIWDELSDESEVMTARKKQGALRGVSFSTVALSDLTFPHQATRPEDVPVDQPWLVDVEAAHVTARGIPGFREGGIDSEWRFLSGKEGDWDFCNDDEITLICPLVPERSASDLQAKYDALEAKYEEAKKRVKALEKEFLPDLDSVPEGIEALVSFVRWQKEGAVVNGMQNKALAYRNIERIVRSREQASTPRTVSTRADYAALPIGSIASEPDTLNTSHAAFKKRGDNRWEMTGSKTQLGDRHMAQMNLTVLQYGWGDEQPEWRIEHDNTKLRVGEYIIDRSGDGGTVTHRFHRGNWGTDGEAYGNPSYGPWVVFLNKNEATHEAVEEAKRARDKETEK